MTQEPVTINQLLEYLTLYGGKIVSSASLDTIWIEQARASGRLYVDENFFGFVWEPDIKGFPTSEKEINDFERWYPLPIELPDEMKTIEFANRIIESVKRKKP